MKFIKEGFQKWSLFVGALEFKGISKKDCLLQFEIWWEKNNES